VPVVYFQPYIPLALRSVVRDYATAELLLMLHGMAWHRMVSCGIALHEIDKSNGRWGGGISC
jgi:hypothetical protein